MIITIVCNIVHITSSIRFPITIASALVLITIVTIMIVIVTFFITITSFLFLLFILLLILVLWLFSDFLGLRCGHQHALSPCRSRLQRL